jgi:MFS family permease
MGMTAPLMNQVSILGEQGFTSVEAVSAIGLLGLFSAFGKFLFGFLCDRVNPRYATAISYALIAFCLVVMLHAHTSAHLLLYAVFMGLGQGGWAPNIAMLTAYYFGRKHYGVVLGAVHLIFITGEAVGPMIAGFAFDRTGSYRMILTLFALLCFISVPLIAFIKKPKST